MSFLQFFLPGGVIGFYFAFCAVIDGVEYKTGMGINKKEARLKAAHLAVEELLSNLETDAVVPEASGKLDQDLRNIVLLGSWWKVCFTCG